MDVPNIYDPVYDGRFRLRKLGDSKRWIAGQEFLSTSPVESPHPILRHSHPSLNHKPFRSHKGELRSSEGDLKRRPHHIIPVQETQSSVSFPILCSSPIIISLIRLIHRCYCKIPTTWDGVGDRDQKTTLWREGGTGGDMGTSDGTSG